MMGLASLAVQARPNEDWKFVCIGPQIPGPVLVGERDDAQDQVSAPLSLMGLNSTACLPHLPLASFCACCRSIALRVRCHASDAGPHQGGVEGDSENGGRGWLVWWLLSRKLATLRARYSQSSAIPSREHRAFCLLTCPASARIKRASSR